MTSEAYGVILSDWQAIATECELTVAGIARRFEIPYANVNNWINKGVIPQKKNVEVMEKVMAKLKETKRIPYHPSFGYATAEQIAKLKGRITEYERNQILAQVEKQTKHGGKID